jgi:hypothetical protein
MESGNLILSDFHGKTNKKYELTPFRTAPDRYRDRVDFIPGALLPGTIRDHLRRGHTPSRIPGFFTGFLVPSWISFYMSQDHMVWFTCTRTPEECPGGTGAGTAFFARMRRGR